MKHNSSGILFIIMITSIAIISLNRFTPRSDENKSVESSEIKPIQPKVSDEISATPETIAPPTPQESASANKPNSDQTMNPLINENTPKTKVAKKSTYLEAFPGLNTYIWLFKSDPLNPKPGDDSPEKRDRLRKFIHDPYYGKLDRLVDLKKYDFINMKGRAFVENLRDLARSGHSDTFIFQNKKLLDNDLHELDSKVPFCKLRVDLEMAKMLDSERVSIAVDRVEFPNRTVKGFEGVSIFPSLTLSAEKEYFWIHSLTCFAPSDLDDRYKELQVIHLLATLGVDG